jgi:hypothetical protein
MLAVVALTVGWWLSAAAPAAPVAHWRFDEEGGTIAQDSIGGFHGTLQGNVRFAPGLGASGGAVRLDRAPISGGLVNMGNVLGLTGTDFTIVEWVKTPSPSNMCALSKSWGGGTPNGYFLSLNTDGTWGQPGKAFFYDSIHPGAEVISTTTVTDGPWHQVVVVHQSSVKEIYVDGVLEASKPSGGVAPNVAPLLVGGVTQPWGALTGLYSGLIDDVQVYYRALSAVDVKFLFDHPGQDLQPIAHWKFDETSGVTAFDSVGGFHGTLEGNAEFVPGLGASGGAVRLDCNGLPGGSVSMGNVLGDIITGGDFSISLWLNTKDQSEHTIVISKHNCWSNMGFNLGINSSGPSGLPNKAWFATYPYGDEMTEVVSSSDVNNEVWHHVVGVYHSGGDREIYVDGRWEEGAFSTNPVETDTAPFQLGGFATWDVPGTMYTGLIDDVQVYDQALTPEEVQFLFTHPGQVVGGDTTPPEVSCATNRPVLWPPNHKMVEVAVSVQATDDYTSPEDLLLLGVLVSSDEPDDAPGSGDGKTTGDTHGSDGFTAPVDVTDEFTFNSITGRFEGTILLRAERDGNGDGRTYTIEAMVLDSQGNLGSNNCVVVVPHDQGKT